MKWEHRIMVLKCDMEWNRKKLYMCVQMSTEGRRGGTCCPLYRYQQKGGHGREMLSFVQTSTEGGLVGGGGTRCPLYFFTSQLACQ